MHANEELYPMLNAVDEELYPGCENHSVLSAVARMLNIKSEHHLSEKCYDLTCQLMREALPKGNKMVESFYETKKLVKGLGLPYEKIDYCKFGCMIYWGVYNDLTSCKFCGNDRYKRRRGSGKHKKVYNHLGSLLEKFSCSASKLHLKPRRKEIFIQALLQINDQQFEDAEEMEQKPHREHY